MRRVRKILLLISVIWTPFILRLRSRIAYFEHRRRAQGERGKKVRTNSLPEAMYFFCLLVAISLHTSALAQQSSVLRTQHLEPLVEAVDAAGMTVHDMDRSLDFYTKVLSFELVSDVEVWGSQYEQLQGVFGLRMRVVRLRLEDEFLELSEYLAPKGRPIPVDSRSNDRWFQHVAIVVSDMDRAYAWLRKHKVQHASSGPQRLPDWNPNAGGIKAFYFKDLDGHSLEVLWFPPGKGDPKWQITTNKLFLGIDHTAIVVNDTEKSLKFYRDLLGFKIAGASENYGTEQEHLNNVAGARLRITGLRASAGPGIEFLEYLTPRDGRPIPRDSKANDLWHWQTRLTVSEPTRALKRLRSSPRMLVSSDTVTLTDATLGFTEGFLTRDPDGHIVQITAR